MTLEEIMYAALAATGIEVTQEPVKGKGDKYLTWQMTSGAFDAYASNMPARVRMTATVHMYSRVSPTSDDRAALIRCLMDNGIRVIGWGALDYEDDTKWYHLPVNVRVQL